MPFLTALWIGDCIRRGKQNYHRDTTCDDQRGQPPKSGVSALGTGERNDIWSNRRDCQWRWRCLGLLQNVSTIQRSASRNSRYWQEYSTQLTNIVEHPLTDPDAGDKVLSPSHIGNTTYLAAYYDTAKSERHIIYQDDGDASVHDYNITQDSRMNRHFFLYFLFLQKQTNLALGDKISNANPISTTPLAVVYIAKKSQVHLYYCVKSGNLYKLRRIIRDSNGNWGSASYPAGAPDLNQSTQISVTATSEKSVNHVFYVDTKSKFVHFDDKWV